MKRSGRSLSMGARDRAWAHRLAVATVRGLCVLLSPLPIGALRGIGSLMGRIAFRLNGRAVRTTGINIGLVYPDATPKAQQRLVRDSIRHTAMTVLEAVAIWTWSLPRLSALVRSVEGEHLLRDRAPDRGLLVLILHHGNWEFIGYYLNTVGQLAPLYEQPKSPVVDAALRAARARLGNRSAPGSVGGLRQLLNELRAGGMVAVLPDQVPTAGSGVSAPFFGRDVLTMTLVCKLLQRVDVDVVMATAVRVRGGFTIRIAELDEEIRDADPARSARAMNAAIEVAVGPDPEQYQWEYKRFRFPRQPNVYR